MVMSVVVSVVFGFILLVAVTFAVPDVQGTLDAGANAVVYIWTESLGEALGGVPAARSPWSRSCSAARRR